MVGLDFSQTAPQHGRRRSYEQFYLSKDVLASKLMNCSDRVRMRVGILTSGNRTGKDFWFDPDKVLKRMDELEKQEKKAEFLARMQKARLRRQREKQAELDANDWLAGRLK